MRIFLGVNLEFGSGSFSLGHHVFNCKGVLEGIGISFTLCLLLPLLLRLLFCPRGHHFPHFLFLSPCLYFGTLRRFLGVERLLRRRKRKGCGRRKGSWIFSDIFWIVYLVCSPQIRVHRDSCLIKGLIVCFNIIIPTDHCHLRN